jgi:hypothetical protein
MLTQFFRRRPNKDELIKKKILPPDAPKVFGADLAQLLGRTHRTFPLFMENAIEYLRGRLDVEGMFRVSASVVQISEWQKKIDVDESINLGEILDPHLVGALLKAYVREMPQPVLPCETFSQLENAYKAVEGLLGRGPLSADQLGPFVTILLQLPEPNRVFAQRLFSYLHDVQCASDENLMTAANLGIVFGQYLLRRGGDADAMADPGAAMADLKTQTGVVRVLAEFWPVLASELPAVPPSCTEETTAAAAADAAAPTTSGDFESDAPLPRARVAFDFKGDTQKELEVHAGDEIEILSDRGTGWLKARRADGVTGWVPESFVERL